MMHFVDKCPYFMNQRPLKIVKTFVTPLEPILHSTEETCSCAMTEWMLPRSVTCEIDNWVKSHRCELLHLAGYRPLNALFISLCCAAASPLVHLGRLSLITKVNIVYQLRSDEFGVDIISSSHFALGFECSP